MHEYAENFSLPSRIRIFNVQPLVAFLGKRRDSQHIELIIGPPILFLFRSPLNHVINRPSLFSCCVSFSPKLSSLPFRRLLAGSECSTERNLSFRLENQVFANIFFAKTGLMSCKTPGFARTSSSFGRNADYGTINSMTTPSEKSSYISEIKLIWAFEVHRSCFITCWLVSLAIGTKNAVRIGLNYFYFTSTSDGSARLSIARIRAPL